MKTKRYIVAGLTFLALIVFGWGCGGSGTTVVPGNIDGASGLQDPNPAGPTDQGSDDGDSGDSGNGGVFADMDHDGIPDTEDVDADGDGFLASEDDCNDANPEIFPGAADKPDYPTYIDSNCDGSDGDVDAAFWVSTDGNDANPGTIDQPFLTIQAAINAATADDAIITDVYVVEGIYNEDASLADGVGLYGGYGALADGKRARDLNTYTTELHNVAGIFWVGPTSSGQESVVEGLLFKSISGSPALAVMNSSPTLRHNKIYGVDSPSLSVSVYVLAIGDSSVSKPTFYDNLIQSADCVGDEGDCRSIAFVSISGGDSADVEPTLASNDIRSGVGYSASVGIYSVAGDLATASLIAFKNNIEAEAAESFTVGILLGYDLFEGGLSKFTDADIYQNRISGGHDAFTGWGAVLTNSTDIIKLRNNFITGGRNTMMQSGGIYADKSTVTFLNNTINSGASAMSTVAIELGANTVSKIDNNIFFSEPSGFEIGIVEMQPTSTPTSLRNNLFDLAMDARYNDFMLGNIVDIAVVNAMPDIPANGNNIAGVSFFKDVAANDYHLTDVSAAIDAGIDLGSEVTVDIDDESRTDGLFDIGADEFVE